MTRKRICMFLLSLVIAFSVPIATVAAASPNAATSEKDIVITDLGNDGNSVSQTDDDTLNDTQQPSLPQSGEGESTEEGQESTPAAFTLTEEEQLKDEDSVWLFPDAILRQRVFEAVKGQSGNDVYDVLANFSGQINASYQGGNAGSIEKITNPEGLQYLRSAQRIDLSGNNISDWTGLESRGNDWYHGVTWDIEGNPIQKLPQSFGGDLTIELGVSQYQADQETPNFIFASGHATATIDLARCLDSTGAPLSIQEVRITSGNTKAQVQLTGNQAVITGLGTGSVTLSVTTQDAVHTYTGGQDISQPLSYHIPFTIQMYQPITLKGPDRGSFEFTLTDGTKPVSGAEYNLYRNGAKVQGGLRTDSKGRIVYSGLIPGDYTLVQVTAAKGYELNPTPVAFSLPEVSLDGGRKGEIPLSDGTTIQAEDGATYVSGPSDEDVVLTSTGDSASLKFSVDWSGTKEDYSSLAETMKAINDRKTSETLNGPVVITASYSAPVSVKGQVDEIIAEEPSPTPTPTPTPDPTPTPSPVYPPNNNNNGSGGTVTRPQSTPTPQATPTPAPITTPSPTTTPSATPTPAPTIGQLTLAVDADNGVKEGFLLEVVGKTTADTAVNRQFKTDATGQVVCTMSPGTYTVSPVEGTSNRGYELPEGQSVSIAAGENITLTFNFTASQRDLILTVVDDDGVPLSDVTIGIFAAKSDTIPEEKPVSDTVDVSAEMEEYAQEQEEAEREANPYAQKNALMTGRTNEEGIVTIDGAPVTDLEAVAIGVPDGYSLEKVPAEIPAGLETQFEVLCEYIKVDLNIINDTTGGQVVDAEAVLYNSSGDELANWLTDGKIHRLIRVPEGDYTVELRYKDQTQKISYTVTSDQSLQEVDIKTYLKGSNPQKSPVSTAMPIIIVLLVVAGLALIGLAVVGFIWYKKYRRRAGGYH